MLDRVDAPFTDDQVRSLNGYQKQGCGHPFTCGNDTCNHVSLVATRDGWECPQCHNWKQTWAHKFMADREWKNWAKLIRMTPEELLEDLMK